MLYHLRSVNHNVYFLFAETLTDPRSSKFSSERFRLVRVGSWIGIVEFDIWSKCKLYCVPSLRSIIAGWGILFSVFCFSIYFLKAWFLVEKVGFWSSYLVPRNGENAGFYTIYPRASGGLDTPCSKAASSRRQSVSDLRTHHFGLATPLSVTLTPTCIVAFSSGAVTTCFHELGDWSVDLGFVHPTFRLRAQRSNPLCHRRGFEVIEKTRPLWSNNRNKAVFRALYIFCNYSYAKNDEKRRDPHPICRRSIEKRLSRTLKMTLPYHFH